MISREQLHVGRISLGLNVAQLAKLAGVAPNSIHGIERGADFKASTMRALQEALASAGVLFGANGSICVRMQWPNGRPASKRVREATLGILNSARKSCGQAPFVDLEMANE